jgi:serine/threonine protein kinase
MTHDTISEKWKFLEDKKYGSGGNRHPWPGMDNTWTAIFHIAKASSGPPIPESSSELVKDFLSHCFRLDPKKRPTSTEVNTLRSKALYTLLLR